MRVRELESKKRKLREGLKSFKIKLANHLQALVWWWLAVIKNIQSQCSAKQ